MFPSAVDVRHARFSPDGRWLAYISEEAGAPDVYLRPFAASRAAIRVSTTGGAWPRWRQDGRELFYSTIDGTIMAVAVRLGTAPVLSAPQVIGAPAFASRPLTPQFEVSPDGQQFFILARREDRQSLTLFANWPARLRGR